MAKLIEKGIHTESNETKKAKSKLKGMTELQKKQAKLDAEFDKEVSELKKQHAKAIEQEKLHSNKKEKIQQKKENIQLKLKLKNKLEEQHARNLETKKRDEEIRSGKADVEKLLAKEYECIQSKKDITTEKKERNAEMLKKQQEAKQKMEKLLEEQKKKVMEAKERLKKIEELEKLKKERDKTLHCGETSKKLKLVLQKEQIAEDHVEGLKSEEKKLLGEALFGHAMKQWENINDLKEVSKAEVKKR